MVTRIYNKIYSLHITINAINKRIICLSVICYFELMTLIIFLLVIEDILF